MFTRHILWGVVACSILCIVQAFYVPGVAPVEFIKGQSVEVKVMYIFFINVFTKVGVMHFYVHIKCFVVGIEIWIFSNLQQHFQYPHRPELCLNFQLFQSWSQCFFSSTVTSMALIFIFYIFLIFMQDSFFSFLFLNKLSFLCWQLPHLVFMVGSDYLKSKYFNLNFFRLAFSLSSYHCFTWPIPSSLHNYQVCRFAYSVLLVFDSFLLHYYFN